MPLQITNGVGKVGVRRSTPVPQIITNQLKLNIDAGNISSYPGSGTLWNDLSLNNNNVTLFNFNSPSPQTIWNSSNGGSIVFDGTNDYGRGLYNSTLNLSTNNYTLEGWFNSTSFSNGQTIISKDTSGQNFDWCIHIPNSTQILFGTDRARKIITATVPTMSINTWYHVIITSVAGTINIYLNGVLYKTQYAPTTNDSGSYFTIGCLGWNNPNGFMKGKISVVRVYLKAFSQSEVLQNYNALKGRYGL